MGRAGDLGRRLVAPALLAILVAVPSAPLLASFSAPAISSSCAGATTNYNVNATVTWNGVDVCTARSSSSPLKITFSQTADILFNWTALALVNLTDARLAMYYAGFPIVTRDVSPVSPGFALAGQFDLNWTPSSLTYAFEGLFRITATIFGSNGSTAFRENFFVRASAPGDILAVLPIVLVALGIYEAYGIATSGRQARLVGRPPARPPPGAPAPSEPAAPSADAAEAAPPAPSAEPPAGGTP
jgi:hypothetical protein